MTAPASRVRVAALDLPPLLLALVAEGAWIALLYTLIQTARGEPLVLGTPAFALFAAAGLLAARLFGRRLAADWAWAVIGLMVAAALVGWLLADTPRSALGSGDLAGAVGRHQGGFLAALAVLRGTAHAVPATSERSLARLVAWGTPLLAVPLLIAQALPEPGRSAFEEQALVECLTFLLAATMALALLRVANLGRSAGFAWDRNRAWLVLAVVVALLAIVALPAAFFVGPAVRVLVALALPLLLIAATIASVGSITLRAVAIVGIVGLAIFAISRLALQLGPAVQSVGQQPAGSSQASADPTATAVEWLPVIALVLLLIVFLVRRWLRRRPPVVRPTVAEERWSDAGPGGDPWRPSLRLRLGRSRAPEPGDAAAAYLATLADLRRVPALARGSAETPAAHARRLRDDGTGTMELDLLAADYELARFAGRALSPAEDRRALGRWRRIRAKVGR